MEEQQNFGGHNSCILLQNSEAEVRNIGKIHTTQMCKKVNALWGKPWPMGSGTNSSSSKVDNCETIQHSSSKSLILIDRDLVSYNNCYKNTLLYWLSLFSRILFPVPWHYWSPLQYFYSRLGLNPCFPGRIPATTTTLVFWYFMYFLSQK